MSRPESDHHVHFISEDEEFNDKYSIDTFSVSDVQILCEEGNIDMIKKLFDSDETNDKGKRYKDIFNTVNKFGNTVFHWSSTVELLDFFASHGFSYTSTNFSGQTGLFTASNIECIDWFIKRLNKTFDYDLNGRHPGFFFNDVEKFKYLTTIDPIRFSPSHIAFSGRGIKSNILFHCGAERLRYIKTLDNGKIYKNLDKIDGYGNTPLFYAKTVEDVDEILLDDEIDINYRVKLRIFSKGRNALSFVRSPEVFAYLIERGCDVMNIDDSGLYLYNTVTSVEILRKLVEINREKNYFTFNEIVNDMHPIEIFLSKNSTFILELKDTTFNCNTMLKSGGYAFDFICRKFSAYHTRYDLMKTIVDAGFDVNIHNGSLLDNVEKYSDPEGCIKLLLDFGYNIDNSFMNPKRQRLIESLNE